MPRYYFDLYDGDTEPDTSGTELPGLDEARLHAIRYAGEVLQRHPEWLDGKDLRVEVRNSAHLLLFTIIVLAISSAAAQARVA